MHEWIYGSIPYIIPFATYKLVILGNGYDTCSLMDSLLYQLTTLK